MTRNAFVVLDFQLVRCIAKIAEVVYPKLESRRVAPLTPRRRTGSISVSYGSPSPVPGPENEDSSNTTEVDNSANAKEVESEEETVEGWSPQKKVSQGDHCTESRNSADDPRRQSDVGAGDHSSSPAQTPEPSPTPQDSASQSKGGKHASAMTKMLFEILQNLLADVLAILEKVTKEALMLVQMCTFIHRSGRSTVIKCNMEKTGRETDRNRQDRMNCTQNSLSHKVAQKRQHTCKS